jgi:small-conductance mechanosensitive channel
MTANLFVDSLEKLWNDFISLLPNIAAGLVALLIFYLFARIIRWLTRRYLGKFKISELGISLISSTVFIAISVLGVFVSLGIMGVNTGALVASMGLFGVALGFALKDVIENFVAGFVVILQRPFEAGDMIIIGDIEGEVLEVRIRDTVILMYDGRQAFVPNASIFTQPLTNNTRTRRRRMDLDVGISYSDDTARAMRVAVEALDGIDGVLDDPSPFVVAKGFEESSVGLKAYFWIDPVESDFLEAKSAAIAAVKKSFQEAGIEIPFPIVTVNAPAGA